MERSNASFSELSSAVDIDDLPGTVYTKMDVINEVLKPPANIVQSNTKPKFEKDTLSLCNTNRPQENPFEKDPLFCLLSYKKT